MKTALISRYAAYGDIIHMSFLPRLLKDKGYDIVDVETNHKGHQLLDNNPFIDQLTYFEPTQNMNIWGNSNFLNKHWDIISEGYTKFINLYCSLEHNCIAMESMNEYFMHSKNREWMRDINFYDQTLMIAGYKDEVGKWQGEVYYKDEEHKVVSEYMDRFKDKYVIMVNLSGTTIHKKFIILPELVKKIRANIPNAHFITTGDKTCKDFDLEGDDITSIVDTFPFRQALLIAKHVDLLLSMESGLAVGGNMWGTPTIQLMTSSSLYNHPKYAKNDYSLQSPAYCSPCSKGPYRFIGCPHKDGYPLCIFFDVNEVFKKVMEAYASRNTKN